MSSMSRTIRRNVLRRQGLLPSVKRDRRKNQINLDDHARALSRLLQKKFNKVQDEQQ